MASGIATTTRDREPLRPGQPLADSREKAYLLAYEFDGEEAFAG
jgi:hypothetical protein